LNQLNSLRTDPGKRVLDHLHAAAKRDRWRFLGLAPSFFKGFVQGKSLMEMISSDAMKGCFIPVSREQGEFLYVTARALNAKTIVEFGTSFGISTIYLAAALKDNGGGRVISTELEPNKCRQAKENLRQAGLSEYADIRQGDALETLSDLSGPVDMVLLDGWKDLYLPVLGLIKPALRPRAVVLADNIFTFRKALRPYVEYMQDGANGFASTTVPIGEGFEYSVYLG
jgi:predicted O-methyltransferase YrrM